MPVDSRNQKEPLANSYINKGFSLSFSQVGVYMNDNDDSYIVNMKRIWWPRHLSGIKRIFHPGFTITDEDGSDGTENCFWTIEIPIGTTTQEDYEPVWMVTIHHGQNPYNTGRGFQPVDSAGGL